MTVLRKRAQQEGNKVINGLYIHSSPPRVLQLNSAYIKQIIRSGDVEKMEQLVLEGQGKKLLGEYSADYKTRTFLKSVQPLMSKISLLHDAVNNGRLDEIQSILEEDPGKKNKMVASKDESGVGLLHKAVYYDLKNIYRWLLEKFPQLASMRDAEGRTPYHYTPMCRDPNAIKKLLKTAGADPSAVDNHQKTVKYYEEHKHQLELPSSLKTPIPSRKTMQIKEGLSYKKSNIRIWIHQRNMECLQGVVWGGHGGKLLVEHSNNAKMKRFLETVPHIMGLIKEVHCDVQNGDLESLISHSNPPAPTIVLSARDSNGLTPLHKAAGLDKMDMAKYILKQHPECINATDKDGRTPLHYAAILKDDGKMMGFLIDNGADESALDNKQKTAAYYKTRSSELDTKLLNVIPECPRTAKDTFPIDWSMWVPAGQKVVKPSGEKPKDPKKPNEENNNETKQNLQDSRKTPETPRSKSRDGKSSVVEGNRTRPQSRNQEAADPKAKLVETPRSKSREGARSRGGRSGPILDGEKVIEGVVEGDAGDKMNNEGINRGREEEEEGDVEGMISSGNMEKMAALVLNGEGRKLVGRQSDNTELQSFLDNVPVYMSKISKIHEAARNGSLRDLQAALDRRKFAIAKDPISPKGASPLHVAVIFGNTNIVRYLAGRFPETVQVKDEDGRTPLHYAAVLKDNGHYYSLLVHLGADVREEDNFGRTPEYYRTNQRDFSHRTLLGEFGAEEDEADEILADKDKNQENGQVDMPFFATEEGRYLASSLGDPLIKGLTEVANKRPDDPIAYLAQYLYNFANNRGNLKSRGRTQENQHLTSSTEEVENRSVPTTIDVVTVDPEEPESDESAFNSTSRDEHGQSMLHFAAARGHGRNALFQLLLETEINVAYRDELYRTARDISIQANLPDNTEEIDRYVLHIATKGDTDKLVELLLDGYDHITDVIDDEEVPIVEAVSKANQPDTVSFLQSILAFEEKRERVHHAIRQNNLTEVKALLADENDTGSGKLLAIGKNSYGRCSLHIAVLCQQEEIVDYLASTFPDVLKLGDNLERTALHYAMGVEKIETISRVLIKAGAKRITKDLKGRQPTYYYLNKSDILRLQEEEETF